MKLSFFSKYVFLLYIFFILMDLKTHKTDVIWSTYPSMKSLVLMVKIPIFLWWIIKEKSKSFYFSICRFQISALTLIRTAGGVHNFRDFRQL